MGREELRKEHFSYDENRTGGFSNYECWLEDKIIELDAEIAEKSDAIILLDQEIQVLSGL